MAAMLVLKVSLVLSAVLLGAWLLRHAPPTTRHRYWSAAFGAVLLLPLLVVTMPAVTVPVPAGWHAAASLPFGEPRDRVPVQQTALDERSFIWKEAPLPAVTERPDPAPLHELGLSVQMVLLSVWVIGTCLAIAALMLSLLRVRRLSGAATEMDDSAWRAAASAIGACLACRRSVRVLIGERVTTPMASGVWRPTVFLPLSARAWTADHRDVVLAHEIAHLASGDPLRHLMTRLAVAVYWFHPLAWIAARQAGIAREQACDAAVLSLGTRPSVYARVLLDLAESMDARSRLLAALPMIQRSLLEMRLMTILQDARPVMPRLATIPLFAVGVFTLAVAAAQPDVPAPAPEVVLASVIRAIDAVEPGTAPASTDAPPTVAAVPMVGLQASAERDCWGSGSRRADDVVIQRSFGDLRLCLVAEDMGDRGSAALPSHWVVASRFVMEARRGSLRGEISSIRGQQSSLQGEISSLRGQVSSMRGRISSLRGEESSLRGQISSIRGDVSSLRGAISSKRGEISSLNAGRFRADDAERARVAASIARHEAEIARIEQDIRAYDADTKIAAGRACDQG